MEGLSSAWCGQLTLLQGPRSVSMPLWALWLSRPPPGGSSAHSRPGWARCPGADHVVLQEPLHQQPLEGGDGTVVAAAVGASLAALPASPWAETGVPRLVYSHAHLPHQSRLAVFVPCHSALRHFVTVADGLCAGLLGMAGRWQVQPPILLSVVTASAPQLGTATPGLTHGGTGPLQRPQD